jgi:two-component system LytT family response regulator
MQTKTAIIIDDMALARKALRADIETYCPEINIIGEAESVVSGAKLISSTTPDITFLDIHLNDGEGFDILEILPSVDTKVIFTTASDQHAIQAFRFSAVDYLLKPIDPHLLQKAVEKAINLLGSQDQDFSVLKSNMTSPDKLSLHTAEQIKVVGLEEIIRLEAMGNYTQFFFKDTTKLLVTRTLKEYSDMLTSKDFLRVHQSHLINLRHLKAYIKSEGGYLLMNDKSRIPVSVRKKPSVIQAIDAYAEQ